MISRKISENICYFALLLISVSIPTQIITYKIGIFILVLNWILSSGFSSRINRLKKYKYAVAVIVFYLLYIISFFWSTNHEFGISDLILKSPLFFFPLVLATSFKIEEQKLKNIF